MKAWFTRIRQALSGILINLKHKFGKPQLQKFAALLHARMQTAKEWLKESYLIAKCALLIFAIKLYMAFTPEALKSYWEWIRNLPSQFTRENFKKWWAAFLVWLKTLPETLKGLRKSGVLASLTLFALLIFMGHSATTAWLTYTTPADRNTFQVGQMDLFVEYRNDTMANYKDLTDSSEVFNDKALYEPGYTQVVYLRITNRGDIPFKYKVSARAHKATDSTNVYGDPLHLPDYLSFGLVFAKTEDELIKDISPRAAARKYATYSVKNDWDTFYKIREESILYNGDVEYAALIVWMPEETDNKANYQTGYDPPQVELGLTVFAQQHDAPIS